MLLCVLCLDAALLLPMPSVLQPPVRCPAVHRLHTPAVLRLAAEEAEWELEPTVEVLQLFQTACQQQLRDLAEVGADSLQAMSCTCHICSLE